MDDEVLFAARRSEPRLFGDDAVADLNASGGLFGKKLVLDVEDDACDPKQARSVARLRPVSVESSVT